VHTLRRLRNCIRLEWVPTSQESDLGRIAKAAAREATEENRVPKSTEAAAKSTITSIQKQSQGRRTLHTKAGQHLQRIDTALPRPHIRRIYDSLKRKQANILVQLRTGMARLNGYLHRIGVVETDKCLCGQATETVKHFLLYCREWEAQREQLLQQAEIRSGTLSYLLGGKSLQEDKDRDKDWTPDMNAVYTTIKFTQATGRLDRQVTSNDTPSKTTE
jgi:hypothetical protein